MRASAWFLDLWILTSVCSYPSHLYSLIFLTRAPYDPAASNDLHQKRQWVASVLRQPNPSTHALQQPYGGRLYFLTGTLVVATSNDNDGWTPGNGMSFIAALANDEDSRFL